MRTLDVMTCENNILFLVFFLLQNLALDIALVDLLVKLHTHHHIAPYPISFPHLGRLHLLAILVKTYHISLEIFRLPYRLSVTC